MSHTNRIVWLGCSTPRLNIPGLIPIVLSLTCGHPEDSVVARLFDFKPKCTRINHQCQQSNIESNLHLFPTIIYSLNIYQINPNSL